jgi:GNAT superfamily N-acetyltransferase
MTIRNAEPSEIDALARLWYEAWQDGHAAVVPEELKQLRTYENFRARIEKKLSRIRVAGPVGEPLGFCIIDGDELNQLFVSAQARGKGVAAELISDAEKILLSNGIKTAWLACAIGNDRAARFYEKSGWIRTGNMFNNIETPDGLIELEVWRYEKELS